MEAESTAKAAARNWTGGAERFMDGESHRGKLCSTLVAKVFKILFFILTH
jgi:hypothetical protein